MKKRKRLIGKIIPITSTTFGGLFSKSRTTHAKVKILGRQRMTHVGYMSAGNYVETGYEGEVLSIREKKHASLKIGEKIFIPVSYKNKKLRDMA